MESTWKSIMAFGSSWSLEICNIEINVGNIWSLPNAFLVRVITCNIPVITIIVNISVAKHFSLLLEFNLLLYGAPLVLSFLYVFFNGFLLDEFLRLDLANCLLFCPISLSLKQVQLVLNLNCSLSLSFSSLLVSLLFWIISDWDWSSVAMPCIVSASC